MNQINKLSRLFVYCNITGGGRINWHANESFSFEDSEEGLFINFPWLRNEVKSRDLALALKPIKTALEQNDVKWLREDSGHWYLDLNIFFIEFPNFKRFEWLKGIVEVAIEIEPYEQEVFDEMVKKAYIQFIITRKEVDLSMPKQIFLSHKSYDKQPIVREYFNALKCIGFEPWLDEEELVAGMPLERALLDGMKKSCAAVFFITPEYKNENYLSTEIDYAVKQAREKGNRFSIITLVFQDKNEKKGVVPELLEKYVWKEPINDLVGLQEIIKALPIAAKQITWR